MTAGHLPRIASARAGVALLVAASALAAAAPAMASRHVRRGPNHPRMVRLSNETTHTTWTVADAVAPIRARPARRARRIAMLQFQTPDGFLQSYIVLDREFNDSGEWVRVRVPGRPNGRTGWVKRGVLADFQVVHTELVVNRAARQLTLYRNGKVIYTAPVGVGKPGTPTPPGHFWITESFASSDPAYGPWAFGTSDYSTLTDWPGGGIVGLHGTDLPALVPGDPSHGCIRLHNANIKALSRLVTIGTPLLVQ